MLFQLPGRPCMIWTTTTFLTGNGSPNTCLSALSTYWASFCSQVCQPHDHVIAFAPAVSPAWMLCPRCPRSHALTPSGFWSRVLLIGRLVLATSYKRLQEKAVFVNHPLGAVLALTAWKRHSSSAYEQFYRTPTSDKATLWCDGSRQREHSVTVCEQRHPQKERDTVREYSPCSPANRSDCYFLIQSLCSLVLMYKNH